MRDITIYSLDRKVFKEIPAECIKQQAVHIRPSILGISLRSTVDVTMKDVTHITITDDELIIYMGTYLPFLVSRIKLPCNLFTRIEIR